MIAAASAHFKALLRIRYASPLFRLPGLQQIQQQVRARPAAAAAGTAAPGV